MHYTFQLPEFLVQNSLSALTQVFQECWSEPPPPHLPSKMQIWSDLDTLGFSWPGPPPPLPLTPLQMQIWTDLDTLGLSWPGSPPNLTPKMQILTDLGNLGLSWPGPPPPSPENPTRKPVGLMQSCCLLDDMHVIRTLCR